MRELDRRIVALALPSLGVLAAEPLYVLVDTAIVGHLGTDALGGLAIAGTALTAVTWLFGFLSMGTTTRVATAIGRGSPEEAATATRQAAALAAVIGLCLLVLLELLAVPIISVLGGSGDVAGAAETYLRIGAIGVPFLLLSFVGHAWWRGHSLAMRSLQVVIVANVLNVVLELLMVYWLDWGIAGSAWGTVCAQVLAAAWLAVGVHLHMRATARARAGHDSITSGWRPMLVDGWRIMVRTLAHVTVFVMASATAARMGDAELGAHQIGMQLFTFLALCLDAIVVPAQVFTGQAFGAGNRHEVDAVVRRCLVIGVLIGAVIGTLVIALSGVLSSIFTDDPAVTSAAVPVLVLLGVLQLPGAVAFVLDGALLGAADYQGLRRATVRAAAVFVPIAVAVMVFDRLGLTALWIGLLAWMCVRALLNTRRWREVRGSDVDRHMVFG